MIPAPALLLLEVDSLRNFTKSQFWFSLHDTDGRGVGVDVYCHHLHTKLLPLVIRNVSVLP